MKKRLFLFLLLTIFFIIFYIIFSYYNYDIILILISFYPLFRLIIDYILVIHSFTNENKTRYIISRMTKGRVPIDYPWSKRIKGILKWLMISAISIAAGVLIVLVKNNLNY